MAVSTAALRSSPANSWFVALATDARMSFHHAAARSGLAGPMALPQPGDRDLSRPWSSSMGRSAEISSNLLPVAANFIGNCVVGAGHVLLSWIGEAFLSFSGSAKLFRSTL